MSLGLGEFDLIGRIVARLGDAAARDIAVPPGDDAAAWAVEAGHAVATVDTLAEGTHWLRGTMSFADVGWRAVATALSDLAAMGARPGCVLIAAELGPGVSLADLDSFADGAAAACRAHGARVAGGNVAAARATAFTTAAYGHASVDAGGRPLLLRRGGARSGDLVAVSGAPGASAAGLALIEAGREGEDGAAPLLDAHRRPRARLALGLAAAAAGARCAVDVSDGLLADLGHVARASGVGIEVDADALPLHPSAAALLGRERALRLALGGGEDYELAIAAPAAALRVLAAASEGPLAVVGRAVASRPGEALALGPDGEALSSEAAGWDHLRAR